MLTQHLRQCPVERGREGGGSGENFIMKDLKSHYYEVLHVCIYTVEPLYCGHLGRGRERRKLCLQCLNHTFYKENCQSVIELKRRKQSFCISLPFVQNLSLVSQFYAIMTLKSPPFFAGSVQHTSYTYLRLSSPASFGCTAMASFLASTHWPTNSETQLGAAISLAGSSAMADSTLASSWWNCLV